MDADPQALKEAVALTRKAVRQVDGAYACFIGGLAVQEHGYVRWTDDVDVVVDAAHYSEVMEKMRELGFIITPDGNLQNRDTGAKVDILKEGVTLHNARMALPHPRDLGPYLGFATVPSIVRLKLDAHRRQDLADVVRIMYTHLNEIDAICAALPDIYRKEFLELADEARRETGNP